MQFHLGAWHRMGGSVTSRDGSSLRIHAHTPPVLNNPPGCWTFLTDWRGGKGSSLRC